jgi:hypothetical protein
MSDSEKDPMYLGNSGSLALFALGEKAVVIDTTHNLVVKSGTISELSASDDWNESSSEVSAVSLELASASLVDLNINVVTVAAASRLYTIPKGAKAEAEKALEWHKEHKRGGTPVGMNTARTLARGGQIGIEKVRHIAKYFPRHEVDKKGKGWAPGQDNFPSNGRIAWALWGGDVAWRWAQAIVEREDKKPRTASVVGPDLESFNKAMTLDYASAPEFLVRVRMDGSGIDRLYKVDLDGSIYVWDDGCWDDLGSIQGDVYVYDKALDDPYDLVEKSHVPIDPDSAIIVAAKQHQNPDRYISVAEIDAEEAALTMFAANDLDWKFIDYTMTAAGVNPTDNVYSPQERSQNATSQRRGRGGKFAPQGSKSGAPAQQNAVGSQGGQIEDSLPLTDFDQPLDVSGILGEPRTPIDQPYAQLDGTLPAMTKDDLHDVLYNWPAWVQEQRSSFKPLAAAGSEEEKPEEKEEPDDEEVYNHPLLKRWRLNVKRRKDDQPNSEWASPIVAAPAAPKSEAVKSKKLTPETSDVKPLYFAVVAEDDPRAVLDLISIVPTSSTSNSPMAYKRDKGRWVRDEATINDLKSATPPPVIPLDSKTLNEVLLQVDDATVTASGVFSVDHLLMVLWGPQQEIIDTYGDAFFEVVDKNNDFDTNLKAVFSMVAAGGLDRNRGQAEKLRKYWTVGKGAAKIRWGMGGDWSRCVKNLSKYMGPRSKGYCALRHKEMNGVWTGDKRHRQVYGRKKGGSRGLFSTEYINSTAQTIDNAFISAKADDARERFGIVATGLPENGAKFYIPLLIPEGMESGDGRKFKKGSITWRDLPLPLLWQIKTADGHDGSVVVGRIDTIERVEDGLGHAYGVFDTGAYGREAERLVRNGFIRGISADMDQFEATEEKEDVSPENSEKDDKHVGKKKITINKARVMAATIVPKPAFQECSITLIENGLPTTQEGTMIPDGIYVDDVDAADAEALVACGMVAGAIPVVPPREWFDNPRLKKATPLTVDDDGRVYGHIASWDTNHIGLAYGTKPPRSRSNYAYFHTGVCRTDDGSDVPVGQLTLAGGHASLEASAMEAVKHYDDTGSAIADVHAGEDAYGIWVSGALRPAAQPEQIRALRASAPSGDWRPIRGGLELVAVCQVNVPGFPIARARVASGAVMALVAAGAATLAKLKADPVAEMQARIEKLEKITTPTEELQARVASLKAKVDEVKSEFGLISRDERMKLAEKGEALPDGSYPIRNVEDLKNAIQSYGRSKESDRAKVRKHIEKRARGLNVRHLIPEEWKTAATDAVTASAESLKARVAAAQEALGKPSAVEDAPVVEDVVDETMKDGEVDAPAFRDYKFTPGKNQPRDIEGRFRQVLARLSQDLGDSGLQDVVEKIKEVENITGLGDYSDAAKAGNELLNILDRLDEGSLNKISLENVRSTAAELGKVISNLPLPFTNQAQKVRFSDLPPALKDLMTNMVERVEKKIGKDDAAEATQELKGFMSGSDLYSQSDISSQMARMLRLLT